ncbi:hypothetical protein NP493_913g00027 [Ridgeia piscesae]|uniref:Uncharacterized protein n=1 Tax=Ridgeia piscesae TaxID=27915 RepID=A0AAD9NJU1_RIDPI|nr:hypothetical protein NP493_913g00027 [Ridgeia piscesae]
MKCTPTTATCRCMHTHSHMQTHVNIRVRYLHATDDGDTQLRGCTSLRRVAASVLQTSERRCQPTVPTSHSPTIWLPPTNASRFTPTDSHSTASNSLSPK